MPLSEIWKAVSGAIEGAFGGEQRHRCAGKQARIKVSTRKARSRRSDVNVRLFYFGHTERVVAPRFLVHYFREALIQSCKSRDLAGQGPDGKLLVRFREEKTWILEHVLVTIQQKEETSTLEIADKVNRTLSHAYAAQQKADLRWARPWREVELLVNPNGPLINGGSDGDNGQTGRKLVMDYYGPRIPIGGGALSGKDFSHIDRLGAYAARQAAVTAVSSGARHCQVALIYTPKRDAPLEVVLDVEGGRPRHSRDDFRHSTMLRRLAAGVDAEALGRRSHFFELFLPWNQAEGGPGSNGRRSCPMISRLRQRRLAN